MNEDMTKRSTPARIGISALNLLAPGLGVLRLGHGSMGIAWLAAIPLMLVAVIILAALAPTATFVGAVIVAALILIIGLSVMIGSIITTWRGSAERSSPPFWWSRWYGLVLAWILSSLASNLAMECAHSYYKPFYIPAESMAPTLVSNEKILADMCGGRHPGRGDIIIVAAGKVGYVKRVAALAGDSISMRGGVPIINGVPSRQVDKGLDGNGSRPSFQLIVETFPGETGSHEIYDIGPSELDDMDEQIVPPGHIFVLGDNRDMSADSRVPKSLNGLEMVPVENIMGRPLFIYWSTDRSRIAHTASH